MRAVFRPLFLSLLILVIAFSSVAPLSAQTSDTVTVTGNIVALPLGIAIPETTISLGNIDYQATAQSEPVFANGFAAEGNNGALWTALEPIMMKVVSPATWSAGVCVIPFGGLPATRFRLLSAIPTNTSEANTAFNGPNSYVSDNCNSPSQWLQNQPAGSPNPFTRYIGAWVQSSDGAGLLKAEITFSVTAGG